MYSLLSGKAHREMNLNTTYAYLGRRAVLAGMLGLLCMQSRGASLRLEDAVLEGLDRNSQLFQSLSRARKAAADLIRIQGVYDTELEVNLYYIDSELSSASSPIDSASKSARGDAFLRRRFSTGTSAEFGVESDHVRFSDSPFSDENNQTTATLSLSQSLLRDGFGSQNQAEVEAARARYQSAWLRYLDERDAVALEIHRAFWTAYNEFSSLGIFKRALGRAKDLLEINRKREADGLLDETDVLAAEAALATRKVDVITQQDAYVNAREQLLALIRYPMQAWDDTRLDYGASLKGALEGMHLDAWDLYRDARGNREFFKALELELEAAELEVEAAGERVEPELNLFGRVGVGDVNEEYSDSWDAGRTQWTVGLEFRTTWEKSAERALLVQAELEEDQLRDQIAQAEQDLYFSCRSSTRDLLTLGARLEAAQLALGLQKRKLKLETVKFEQGRSETSRIVDYQDDVEEAEGEVVSAEAAYRIRAAENFRLQGTLSGTPPTAPEPERVME